MKLKIIVLDEKKGNNGKTQTLTKIRWGESWMEFIACIKKGSIFPYVLLL